MASYFDLPPQEKAAAVHLDAVPEKERKQLGGSNLLSPAVTQLLEDLGDEESDTDSEEPSLSEEGETEQPVKHEPSKSQSSEKDRSTKKASKNAPTPQKGERSPDSRSSQKVSRARASGGGSLKAKQPHMARFHSLRSMLFTSNVENKMKEEHQKQEAASLWKSQHEQRQMNRPKTPEKDSHGKETLGTKIKTKLRRITSKDVTTMDTLKEDGAPHDFSDRGSTASSDAEDERLPRGYRDTDEESIEHSDVEDLVRWISRRDPASDGETRAAKKVGAAQDFKEDSGHESLGHSDVEDLVRWVSRKSVNPEKIQETHTGYSDASTEEDSELDRGHVSSEDEDADDLVRWISHREGPIAGPVRQQRPDQISEFDEHISYDSDVPELGRWVKRHDGTSGESLASTPVHEFEDPLEPERGRPRSRDRPSSREARQHLTDDDINDLVRWVSRKDSKQQDSPEHDESLKQIKRQEEAKQAAIGMSVDEGSLSHSDVQDLISHVQSVKLSEPASTVLVSSSPTRPGVGESGQLRRENTAERDAKKFAAQEHLVKSRGESQQIETKDFTIDKQEEHDLKKSEDLGLESKRGRDREGSLGQDDVDELVRWVSQKS